MRRASARVLVLCVAVHLQVPGRTAEVALDLPARKVREEVLAARGKGGSTRKKRVK